MPFTLSLAGREKTFGDVQLRLEATPVTRSDRGYYGCYVTATNLSPDQNHVLDLSFNQRDGHNGHLINQIDRRLVLPAGTRVTVHLPLWSWIVIPLRISVTIDGRRQKTELELPRNRVGYSNQFTISVLSDRDFHLKESFEKFKAANFYEYELDTVTSSVAEWGSHWLDYSSFDLIALNSRNWDTLDGPVQAALKAYLRCGGALFLYGNDGRQILPDAVPDAIPGAPRHAYLGFGIVVFSTTEALLLSGDWEALLNLVFRKKDALPTADYHQMHTFFPVIDHVAIPLRGFLVLLCLFALVLGPLNLWYLARRRKRILLLITVPAISLLTTLLVFGFATFSEGFGIKTRIEGITLLDEGAHEATSLGLGAVYSSLTHGDGLHFPLEADVFPILPPELTFLSVGLGEDQNLRSGWVRARIPIYYQVRKPERRRERLTIRPTDKGFEVVNGLGAPIENVYLTDAEGRIYHCGPVAPGQKAQALAVAGSPRAQRHPKTLRRLFHGNWSTSENYISIDSVQDASLWLTPNSYVAQLNATPFLGPHTSRSDKSLRKSIVIGIREAP